MRLVPLLGLFALIGANPARAQDAGDLRRPAIGAFDVVALRVEFQPDTTRFSTGDGTFGGNLFGGLEPGIDPLPHDGAYFEAHLEYLSTYVLHVSDGAASVRTHLLPDIVRVSGRMGDYAPTGMDADSPEQRVRLARLIEEAWTLADQQISFSATGLDPARTAFLVFHAGVGRDVELTGTTLDRTPEDLPSLFFGAQALEELLPSAQISFKGLSIDHTIILPRTETRRAVDFITDEPFLAEISINGMLAASFFNYLGVPDLFDTASGQSAIGPFGLMDPYGIFAYSGLFAPEPSAWTKYFLGWVEPLDIRGADSVRVVLETNSLFGTNDVARVWLSESEYFLVENRQRDPAGDDLRLTVRDGNELLNVTFANGAEGFNAQDVSAFPGGVVVAVDNYDWALPGGIDEIGNELLGGILIWHVDERVIRQALGENAVNANPGRRGVDLEEADSAEDLGFPSPNPFAPQADLGSPFDFWYEGNPVRVVNQSGQEIALYRNRFGPDTYPSSDASDGGESFVALEGFTVPAVEMSFTYRRVEGEQVTPLSLAFAERLQQLLADPAVRLDVASTWSLADHVVLDARYANDDWLIALASQDGAVLSFEARTPSSRLDDQLVWVERGETGLQFTVLDPETGVVRATPIAGSRDAQAIGAAVVSGSAVGVLLLEAGAASLAVLSDGLVTRTELPEIGIPLGLAAAGPPGPVGAPIIAFGRDGAVRTDGTEQWTYAIGPDAETGVPVFGEDDAGMLGVLPLPERQALLVLSRDGQVRELSVAGGDAFYAVSLADVTGDGQLDILVGGDSLLHAYTRSGAVSAGFPLELAAEAAGAPAVAKGDSDADMLFVPLASGSVDGFARDGTGFHRISWFPLPVGSIPVSVSLSSQDGEDLATLYVLTETETLHAWRLKNAAEPVWSDPYGNPQRTAFVRAQSLVDDPPGPSQRLLVGGQTYNWPNPIRDGRTFLRCLTSADSDVRITIIDGAGTLVDEVSMESVRAGVPTEVMWETNASSGLYFARVTATSVEGQEETHVIKMAVIR